jgi:hypothetical protein
VLKVQLFCQALRVRPAKRGRIRKVVNSIDRSRRYHDRHRCVLARKPVRSVTAWPNDLRRSLGMSARNCWLAGKRQSSLFQPLGLSVELGLSQNWSAKLEYDLMDFGSEKVRFRQILLTRLDALQNPRHQLLRRQRLRVQKTSCAGQNSFKSESVASSQCDRS